MGPPFWLFAGAGHFVAGCFPGIDAACEGLGVAEPFGLIFFRRTGGGRFVGSGTVEDDFPILRNRVGPFLELIQRDRSFQMEFLELLVAVVEQNEERIRIRFEMLMRLLAARCVWRP